MSKKNQATKMVIMLAIVSFASKILGFVRESLIASTYGSGSSTDAFFLALTTISMFSMVVASSIGTTLIPVLSEVEKNEGKEGKKSHLNNFITIISLVSIILVVFTIVAAPYLLKVLAVGFDEESFNLVLLLTKIGAPTILFSSILGVYKGYLESEGLFKQSSLSMLLTNLVMVTFLVTLANRFDVRVLMVVYVIAQAAPIIPLYITLKSNDYSYKYHFDLKDPYIGKVMMMLPPILVSVAINELNAVADNAMASTLVTGSVSALQYARRIEGISLGIFIGSILTVLFPLLSKEATKENKDDFKKVIVQGTNIIQLITIPATVGMIVLATPIIRLAFERNLFTPDDTIMASGALVFFSLGLMPGSIKLYIHRVFYTLQDTKTPTINSGLTVLINIILNLMLISSMKHRGLALATSLAAIISSVFLLFSLRRKIGPFGVKSIVVVGLKSLVASLGMGVVSHYSYVIVASKVSSGSLGLLISLLISVLLSITIYFILLLVLRVKELDIIVDKIKIKWLN